MEIKPIIILVSGLPCSGKTTLAKLIARDLGFPLIHKDGIKEILMDQFEYFDRAWSQKLSVVTYKIMFHLMNIILYTGISLVSEANFPPELTLAGLNELGYPERFDIFELFCVTNGEILLERFKRRAVYGERHPGHLDEIVLEELRVMINRNENGFINLGGGFYKVDTSEFGQVDISGILANICKHRSEPKK